jgi:hypothetical protein
MRNIKRQPRRHKRAYTHADMTRDKAVAHVRNEARVMIFTSPKRKEMSGLYQQQLAGECCRI